jgi:hypothetical protein
LNAQPGGGWYPKQARVGSEEGKTLGKNVLPIETTHHSNWHSRKDQAGENRERTKLLDVKLNAAADILTRVRAVGEWEANPDEAQETRHRRDLGLF